MNKIGIMSMQRVDNYGSYLQAYGLKQLIENNVSNCEVIFIDHVYEQSLVGDGVYTSWLQNKIKIIKNPIDFIRKKIYLKEFHDSMNIYREKIGIKTDLNNSKDIDKLVIGSDEVFNCMQPYPIGYSKSFFGLGYTNVISYAASFGHTSILDLQKMKIETEIASMLKKFRALSVRDENSFSLIKKLTGKEPSVNLDPVLVSEYDLDIIGHNPLNCEYIIVYAYTGRLDRQEEKFIKNFAKIENKKIVSIGNYQKIADYNIICEPLEVFSYFKYADFIITDTFHGTIFSIKTEARFCTIIRDSNKSKLNFLLNKLNKEDRIAKSLSDIRRLYKSNLDYDKTVEILKKEKEMTINYLRKYLDDEK